jgi:hypothetical protein
VHLPIAIAVIALGITLTATISHQRLIVVVTSHSGLELPTELAVDPNSVVGPHFEPLGCPDLLDRLAVSFIVVLHSLFYICVYTLFFIISKYL